MANHPNRNLNFSTDNEAARIACAELGFDAGTRFVDVAVAGSGHIVVRYTAGKPEEILSLARAVHDRGWCWQFADGRKPLNPTPLIADAFADNSNFYEHWNHLSADGHTAETWEEYVRREVAKSARECARLREVNETIRAAVAAEKAAKHLAAAEAARVSQA